MRVEELMHARPITVSEDDSLGLAFQLMRWKGIRHLPVLRGDRVVGVLTETDLARCIGPGAVLSLEGRVRDRMSTDVQTVGPHASLADVAAVLVTNRIGCVPVVDAAMRPLAIVTDTDILSYVAQCSVDARARSH